MDKCTESASSQLCSVMPEENSSEDSTYLKSHVQAELIETFSTALFPSTSSTLTSIAVFLGVLLYLQWRHSWDKGQGQLPPGSFGWPLLGETLEFVMSGKKYFSSRISKHGLIFRSHLIGHPFAVILGSQHVRTVLMASDDVIIQHSPEPIRKLFGNSGFYSLNGVEHKRLQKFVRSLFDRETLSGFAIPMQNIIRKRLQTWLKRGHVMGCQETRHLAFDVANNLLLGLQFQKDDYKQLQSIVDDYNKAFLAFPINMPGFAFYRGMKARKSILELIQERSIAANEDGISILDRIMQQNKLSTKGNNNMNEQPLSISEVKDIALEMLYASQETVASVLCTFLIRLSENKEVLLAIRKELADHGIGQNELLSYDIIQSLGFVNDVMKEALRVAPPVAGVFRRTVRPLEIGGYVIPKGWGVLFGIGPTHDMCQAFEHVTDFDPWRWQRLRSSEHNTTLDKFDYIPFSAGRRICIGQEFARDILKIFLIETARLCDWHLTNGIPEIRTAPVPFPKDNLPLDVNPCSYADTMQKQEEKASEE